MSDVENTTDISAERAEARRRLADAVRSGDKPEDALWEALLAFQGYEFKTAKGLSYSYTIRGGELFFSRKEKSITKATVMMSFRKALELMDAPGYVSGPKKLGTFGASYIYPLFILLGVIRTGREPGPLIAGGGDGGEPI